MRPVADELIVAAFQDELGAENALKTLEGAKRERALSIYDSAIIRRDADNVLHIREMVDWGAGKGAVAGALIGGVIGLLFPPGVLATSLLGATVGVLAVRLKNKGFPDAGIKELGATLKPSTSAIIAIADHESADALEHQFTTSGARVVHQVITTDVSAQLGLDPDVKPTETTSDQGSQVAPAESLAAPIEPEQAPMPISEMTVSTEIETPEAIPPPEQVIDPAVTEGKPDDVV